MTMVMEVSAKMKQLILNGNEDVRRFFQRCLLCVYVRLAWHLSATTLEKI